MKTFARRSMVGTMIAGCSVLIGGCGTDQAHPAVEVRTQTVVKEVQRPCPVTIPQRPAPLTKPLPTDAAKLAATLGAKLVEYAGPGRYADKADAALKICLKAAP